MLITIDQSFADRVDDPSARSQILLALENLAIGRREGKHILYSDRDTLKKIINCESLSSSARQIYRKTYDSVVGFGADLAYFKRQAHVVAVDRGIYTETEKDIVRIILPAQFFIDSFSVQATVLLAEHLIDVEMYKLIGRLWLFNNRKKISKLFANQDMVEVQLRLMFIRRWPNPELTDCVCV